jgi:hypothetical protein
VQTDEPAVLMWMMALAPRPAYRVSAPGHHWWRELVTEVHNCAVAARERLRESSHPAYQVAGAAHSEAACYQLSDEEFDALHPMPRLRDAMVQLSRGSWSAVESVSP